MNNEFLILRKADVESLLPMKDCLEAVEKSFRAYGRPGKDWYVPPKMHADIIDGKHASMMAYIKEMGISYKIANLIDGSVTVNVILYDGETGKLLALLDGISITALRTGAIAGIGAKYLARKDSKVIGVIGTGIQGRTNVQAISELFDIEKVYAANRSAPSLSKYVNEMNRHYDFEVVSSTFEEASREADILLTCTASTEPIVKKEWIDEGTHISAIGADWTGKQELEIDILKKGLIFTDSLEQCKVIGEVHKALNKGMLTLDDIKGNLSEVIRGEIDGRQSDQDITILDSTGVGFMDLASARMVYENALKLGAGEKVGL